MREEEIAFKNARGDRLKGVLHHPLGGKPIGAAILCHGMDSDKNSEKLIYLARALASVDILALRFDFAYVGESSGRFEDITYSGEVEDLAAAYALIQNRQPGKIGLLGSSMGGTVAVLFAASQPSVATLVTIAAPVHPENFPKRMLNAAQLREWRERGFTVYNGRRLNATLLEDLERLDVPQSARQVKCPVLILHGDADQVVPVVESYELHDCLGSAKRLCILKGSDHRLSEPAHMRQALDEALGWLVTRVR